MVESVLVTLHISVLCMFLNKCSTRRHKGRFFWSESKVSKKCLIKKNGPKGLPFYVNVPQSFNLARIRLENQISKDKKISTGVVPLGADFFPEKISRQKHIT